MTPTSERRPATCARAFCGRGRLRRGFAVAGSLALLVAGLASACGLSSDPLPRAGADTTLEVTAVQRAYVTRAFGGPLPVVLLHLEFQPSAPPTLIFQAVGSDGELYRGAKPIGAKICGLADYLGDPLDGGEGGNARTIAFTVPYSVQLSELRWQAGPDSEQRHQALQEETVVCTP